MIPVSRLKKTVSVIMFIYDAIIILFQLSKVNMSAMEEVEVCASSLSPPMLFFLFIISYST